MSNIASINAARQQTRQRRTAYPPSNDCIAQAAEVQRQMTECLTDSRPCGTEPSE